MKIAAVILLLSYLAAPLPQQRASGTSAAGICIGAPGTMLNAPASRCTSASDMVKVSAAPEVRVFRMWDDAGVDQGVLGVIPAGATEIRVDASSKLRLRVRGEGKWPQPYFIHVRATSGPNWKWTVEPDTSTKAAEIRMPAGNYSVSIDAPGHEEHTFQRQLVAGINDVGLIRLKPTPQIFGTVHARASGQPLPAALTSDGVLFATTDEKGNFFGEVQDVRPATLEVTSPGYAPRIVVVPEQTLADLGRIEMAPGAAVRVRIDSNEQKLPTPLTAQLIDRNERDAARRVVRSQAVTTREFSFDSVPAGLYSVLVKGRWPLQQTGRTLELEEGEIEDTVISLEKIKLTSLLTLGDRPLGGHTLEVRHTKSRWQATIATAEDGATTPLELWQSGEFMVQVKGERLTLPFITLLDASAPEEHWKIEIPSATISGKVFDARTGKGIPAAEVTVRSEVEETESFLRMVAAADGSYTVTGIRKGRHQISAAAAGYTKTTSDWIIFSVSDLKTRKVVPIALKSAITRRISVRDWIGQPATDALVLVGGPFGVRDRYTTDGNGVVEISTAAAEDQGAFILVLPSRGSIAVRQLGLPKEGDDTLLVIPPPAGSIRIRATDGATPLEGILFDVRVSGVVLPTEVLLRMSRRVGRLPETDASGEMLLPALPAGTYEIWPSSRTATPPSAPFHVNVTQGETFVAVTLARQSP